ncbi:hypothetical protein FNV43_RR17626 [Rhamnella rubrinervis]|uniref:Uncharacterized protein n=1 Tax=Rhamnella rubrinervis TaxID=2594499 RepID=A0A8K0E430_9ROSA|nr:hypothetical protein FNV43_RR17626 [Rhamnella rubrinervis]
MGTDDAELVELVTNLGSFKVHNLMCTEFLKLVNRISSIFPEIEAARPRCSSGIQALCLLNRAIDKAKSLLQYCSESSKLYLALTGDVIVSRCQRSRSLLEQSLLQIQNNVPVALAVEGATFILDPYEEEAGKVVKELLHVGESASDSQESSEIKALQLAASRLHITSSKAILIEKRSIRKLLEKAGDNDSTKGRF